MFEGATIKKYKLIIASPEKHSLIIHLDRPQTRHNRPTIPEN
jgi:hypothetical protein